MKKSRFSGLVFASVLGMFALTAEAAPIALTDTFRCGVGNATNGITVGDVTGNLGGSSECWGTYDGNDPGPSGDGFIIGGTTFDFVAKQEIKDGVIVTTGDIGLDVVGLDTSNGTWSFDSSKFAPSEFLIVLKAANTPGYAAWLFTGDDAASTSGDWLVAWANDQDNSRNLSHLAVYAPAVPVPAAVWLFGSGLIGLVGIARRKKV